MPETHAEREEPEKRPTIFQKAYQRAYEKWDEADRPGFFSIFYWYIPVRLAGVIAATGAVVAGSDALLDTHFAEEMANVRVMPDSSWVAQIGQGTAQCIGAAAGGGDVYECPVIEFFWGDGE